MKEEQLNDFTLWVLWKKISTDVQHILIIGTLLQLWFPDQYYIRFIVTMTDLMTRVVGMDMVMMVSVALEGRGAKVFP